TDVLREGKTPEDLLGMIFEGIPFKTLEKKGLSFRCTCSRDRIAEVLVSLGRAELRRLAEEKGGAEVTCEFCRTAYRFGRGELEQLIREIESGRPPEAPAPQK
nr:Hsp33 family molecular chaperone HslO [Syntrophobacterales bacterium]